MELINSVFSWIIKKRIHQMELFIKYPMDVQNEVLHQLIEKAKNTEWGRCYDYKSIKSYSDYIERVPLQDYDSLKDQIIRIKQGEQNVLWPTDIKWFAKSSGTTTGKSKFIWGKSENYKMMDYYNQLPITYNNVTYNSVLDFVNALWNFPPEKSKLKTTNSKKEWMEGWIKDKAKFKNHIVYIPFDTIIKFYTEKEFDGKNINYIQIGHKDAIKGSSTKINTPKKSLGLYYLNGTNTENIKGATQFETRLTKNGVKCCKLRIRLKTTSSGSKTGKPTWSFLVALQCVQINPSKCSIDDPIRHGSDGKKKWVVKKL